MNPLCRLLGHRWSKPYLSFGIGFETATAEVYCRRIGCSAKSWVTKIPPWREGEGRPLVERRTDG